MAKSTRVIRVALASGFGFWQCFLNPEDVSAGIMRYPFVFTEHHRCLLQAAWSFLSFFPLTVMLAPSPLKHSRGNNPYGTMRQFSLFNLLTIAHCTNSCSCYFPFSNFSRPSLSSLLQYPSERITHTINLLTPGVY